MKRIPLLIFFTIIAASCSDKRDGTASQDAGTIYIYADPDATDTEIPTLDDTLPDAEPPDLCPEATVGDGYWCTCYPECCQSQQWYCQPHFGDPSVYKKDVIVDVCDDNNEPCIYGQDEECPPPEIIYEGDCLIGFECDPTASGVDLGWQLCTLANGESGLQHVQCDKGQLIHGPCQGCDPEICDGLDNDCDGQTDEGIGIGICETECGPGELICVLGGEICIGDEPDEEICDYQDNDCDGEIDEGQLNLCGVCGDVPEEICDGIDNNCNGTIDLDENGFPLLQPCSTICEDSFKQCIGGAWSNCFAQQPLEEVCNAFDDDCDGQIDEGLTCSCPPEFIGALLPCAAPLLICGQGWQTCECQPSNENCVEIVITECKALCAYIPVENEICEEELGEPSDEICNAWDDDCDVEIDEDLFRNCYKGPEETLDVGICHGGTEICSSGQWGNENNIGIFIEELCLEEQTPLEEELCNDLDDNCDGIIEEEMEETDIVFIIDTSGSMMEEIAAVAHALASFAAFNSDVETIQWSLIVGPMDTQGFQDGLMIQTNLTDFFTFMNAPLLANPQQQNTGLEMLYDAIYFIIQDLIPQGNEPQNYVAKNQLLWNNSVTSTPPIPAFNVSWREDAHHVIVVFSDEVGQSFTVPSVTMDMVADAANIADDLKVFVFSPSNNGIKNTWLPIAQSGGWFELSQNHVVMYDNLMEVLDETACSDQ